MGYSSRAHLSLPIAPDLLSQHFTVDAPDKVWIGDSTCISTVEGWLFLSAVIDLFNGQVAGWRLREAMTRDVIIDVLRMAWLKTTSGVEQRPDIP